MVQFKYTCAAANMKPLTNTTNGLNSYIDFFFLKTQRYANRIKLNHIYLHN